jgi:hypothetical protein
MNVTAAGYAADNVGNRVWVMGDNGPQVFAGTDGDDAGDGGQATSAKLAEPDDLDVGSDGTVFIAERAGNRIRAVATDGTISTVASNLPVDVDSCGGLSPDTAFLPSHLAVAADGSVYVVGKSGTCIERVLSDSSIDAVPRFTAHVHGIAVSGDGGVLISAGQLLTLGEDGWSPLSSGTTTDRLGAVAMAGTDIIAYDEDTSQLLRIAPDTTTTVVAGNGTRAFYGDGGPADGATFSCAGMAIDGQGVLSFGDWLNGRIAVVDTNGVIDTLVGGPFGDDGHPDARISLPSGMTVADGSLYVADQGNSSVYKITADGTFVAVAGTGEKGFSGDGGPATQAQLDRPSAVAVGTDGTVYIADADNACVRQVDTNGNISTLAMLAPQRPVGLLVLDDGSLLATIANSAHLVRISAAGEQSDVALDAQFPDGATGWVSALTVDDDGRVVLFANGQLLVATLGASPLSVDQYALTDPLHPDRSVSGISSGVFDPAGNLLLCDNANRRILRVSLPE